MERDLTELDTLTFELEGGDLYLLLVSPPPLVDAILALAAPLQGKRLYDLGAADGRILIRAARKGAEAVGVESHADLFRHAARRIRQLGLSDRIRLIHGDLYDAALEQADVVVLYLDQRDYEARLVKKLLGVLRRGGRIVTVDARIPGGTPARMEEVPWGAKRYRVYLYSMSEIAGTSRM